jgi:lipoprotein NlpD
MTFVQFSLDSLKPKEALIKSVRGECFPFAPLDTPCCARHSGRTEKASQRFSHPLGVSNHYLGFNQRFPKVAFLLTLTVLLLAACNAPAPSGRRAPIEEYGAGDKSTQIVTTSATPKRFATPVTRTTSKSYLVQKGDTLYSIAFLNGVDYREVAELNNLKDPAAIKIGQLLRLNVAVEEPVAKTETLPKVEVKPIAIAAPFKLGGIKNQPKVGRLIYSEKALVQAERMQEDSAPAVATVAGEQSRVSLAEKAEVAEDALEWGMPTSGKVIAEYSESANRKGVDIVGKHGQAILASAAGKVVYSGSGLRGYGKLIIIKHNKTYLSAYAHNDQILVKEGQSVNRGQKIAEMGNTDADQVKLHFEIRKLGKPVDPAKYLPLVKS